MSLSKYPVIPSQSSDWRGNPHHKEEIATTPCPLVRNNASLVTLPKLGHLLMDCAVLLLPYDKIVMQELYKNNKKRFDIPL